MFYSFITHIIYLMIEKTVNLCYTVYKCNGKLYIKFLSFQSEREMKKILETERLILREYEMSDFDGLYAILSDAETMRHYPRPYDENGTMRWLNWCLDCYSRYGFGLWAIELKKTGEFIGDCGISMQNIDGDELPELGYPILQ